MLRALRSAPVPADQVAWPDVGSGLLAAFMDIWDRLRGRESRAARRSREDIEAEIARMRAGVPRACARPAGGHKRERWQV